MARKDWANKLRAIVASTDKPGERAAAENLLQRIAGKYEAPQPPAVKKTGREGYEYRLVAVGHDQWVWKWVPPPRNWNKKPG